jgi:iron-sulfur cluster assembly protein
MMAERTIHLTQKAILAATKQLAKRGTPDAFLRVGITGSGCHGYAYAIEFADEKHSRDVQFDFDGMKVLVDPKSLVLLDNATLDHETKLVGGGFKWRNPNVASSCGCGESFSVKTAEMA